MFSRPIRNDNCFKTRNRICVSNFVPSKREEKNSWVDPAIMTSFIVSESQTHGSEIFRAANLTIELQYIRR